MPADQKWVKYGVQSKDMGIDFATTADLFYEAEALTPLNGASVATRSGASPAGSVSNNVVSQGGLTVDWRSMLSTQIASGSAHMTHAGEFEVVARVFLPTSNTGAVSLKLTWGQGDMVKRTTNSQVDFAAGHDREGAFVLVSLGHIAIERPSQGSHRWEGRIYAKSTVAGDDLEIDCLAFFPVTEGTGEMSAADQPVDPETKGAGTGADDASVGTVAWSNPSNLTASDDTYASVSLSPGQTSHYLKATNFGFALPSTAVVQGIKVEIEVLGANNGSFDLIRDSGVRIVKGGSIGATDRSAAGPMWPSSVDTYRSYGSSSDLWGETWTAADINASTFGVVVAAHPSTGVGGPYVARVDHVRITVYYTEFPDAALFASRQLELRQDRAERQDSTGAFWNEVSRQPEDYLVLTPRGMENRGNRLIFMASRTNPDTGVDPAIDGIQVQVIGTPVYLSVPGVDE